MANAITSSYVSGRNNEGVEQTCVLTFDTAGTLAVPLKGPTHNPDEVFYARTGGAGTLLSELKITYDDANNEADVLIDTEGDGTVAHVYQVKFVWKTPSEVTAGVSYNNPI